MKRAFSFISILLLISSLACIAGTAKRGVKGKGNKALDIINLPVDTSGNILLPDMVVGTPYTFVFLAGGGVPCKTGLPYTFTVDPTTPLPPGLSLNPNGNLTGTLTAEGDYTFKVAVTDCAP